MGGGRNGSGGNGNTRSPRPQAVLLDGLGSALPIPLFVYRFYLFMPLSCHSYSHV